MNDSFLSSDDRKESFMTFRGAPLADQEQAAPFSVGDWKGGVVPV